MKNRILLYFLALGFLTVGIYSCTTYYFRSNYKDANTLLHETENIKRKPYLKAHFKNGNICILRDSWKIDTTGTLVTGTGTMQDFNRKELYEGLLSLAVDSIAIFETNTKLINPENSRVSALSILAGLDVIMGMICLTNPKACFGSCPTFYINENVNFHYADAEGFSNAISPSLQYTDIDALNSKHLINNNFSLTMKNEALETHCIKELKLLVYPLKDNERVYQSNTDEFYLCEKTYPLSRATAAGKDVAVHLKENDRQEWFSYTDNTNLSCKEELLLTFDKVDSGSNLGLILNFRQTLMTTYFIYSAMGYMGDEVGDIFARMEINKDAKDQLENGIKKELGNIDVFVWDDQNQRWNFESGFYETGPIAINRQIVPLATKSRGKSVRIKLIVNKGLWRLDYAALAELKQKVQPIELKPDEILNKGLKDEKALADLSSKDRYMISMPGSSYKFNFTLPASNSNYELFLSSKGYYLEWMREHWLKDKDLWKLRQMVFNPKAYLRGEAGYYKKYETTMEQEFWNSKIDTKSFSYYEN